MANVNRLNVLQVAKLNSPGRYADGGGLYLRVAEYETKAGRAHSKNWLFRYERGGRERQMGLGSINTLSLAEARAKARECRQALLDGGEPIEARRARKREALAAAAKVMSFRECAEAYIAEHRDSWKNPKHAEQWPSTLQTYVYPVIGDISVAMIDTNLVEKCLRPIWKTIPNSARRIRGRIETVLNWAKAHDKRTGENPARWRGHLALLFRDKEKKAKRVKHHPALPFIETPRFMGELRGHRDVSSRALEFTVLTAARTSETIGARWSEIDLAEKIWTVPADRIKAGKLHLVPLSDRAVEILKALPQEAGSDFVFIGSRSGKPLSNMAMLELLRGLRPGYTVHGFRSTFRDWAGDRTNYAREVIEAALAHGIEDETEAAYRRSTAVEKRTRLMAAWTKFCATVPASTAKVVAIGKRRSS